MKRDILVIGGTRFFGKRLVNKLVENGDRVTVASRNLSRVDFESSVKTVLIEREDIASLKSAFDDKRFDLVYDQICYAPSSADDLCRLLSEKVRRIIYTSSQSIYLTHDQQRETDFDAAKYPIKMGRRSDVDYGEGKRLAEAVYAQRSGCKITSVRFPFVVGADDYMARLDFHVERVINGHAIVAQNPSARTSMIHADEAADFMFWVGQNEINGPVNACAQGEISSLGVIKRIEKIAGKSAILNESGPEDDVSPYAQMRSRYLDCSKAQTLGFQFAHIDDWLPKLIESRVRALA